MATFRSFEDLAKHFQGVGTSVVAATEQATDNFTDFLTERVKANVPVQTGALRDSTHKESQSGRSGEVVRDVVVSAPYARAVHDRHPDQDHAHDAESTEEGHPGRQYASRPVRFHRDKFSPEVRERVGAALKTGAS